MQKQDENLNNRIEDASKALTTANATTQADNQLIEAKLNEVAGKVQSVLNIDLAQMQSVVMALGTLDVQTNLVNASAKMGVMEQTMTGLQSQLTTHMAVPALLAATAGGSGVIVSIAGACIAYGAERGELALVVVGVATPLGTAAYKFDISYGEPADATAHAGAGPTQGSCCCAAGGGGGAALSYL